MLLTLRLQAFPFYSNYLQHGFFLRTLGGSHPAYWFFLTQRPPPWSSGRIAQEVGAGLRWRSRRYSAERVFEWFVGARGLVGAAGSGLELVRPFSAASPPPPPAHSLPGQEMCLQHPLLLADSQ